MKRLSKGSWICITLALMIFFGDSAHSGTKWSEDFVQKVKNTNDVLFLSQCKLDNRQKDVVIVSLVQREVDFLRIQDHSLLVVFGKFSIKDGNLVDPSFAVPQSSQEWYQENTKKVVENNNFSIIFPKNADFVLSSEPDISCNYPE